MRAPLLHIGSGGVGPSWLDWAVQLDVLLLCLVLVWGYLYAVNQLRWRIAGADAVKRSQMVYFLLGVAAIYAADGGPLHDLSDNYLVSAHMLQHLILMMVVPPLFLAGIPGWLWQALLRRRGVLPVARVMANPLVALAAFNGVFLVTHLPSVLDLEVNNAPFHLSVHVVQVWAGMLMWWQVLSPVPELPRLSYPGQMAFLFVQSMVPSVFAALLTFATGSLYDAYPQVDRLWGIGVTEDQQIAGGLMKVLGTLILWSFIGVAFFKWYAREEAGARGPHRDEAAAANERREIGLGSKP